MKKLIFAAIVATVLSSGPVLAESILGDPAGAVTRQEWGMNTSSAYASDRSSPEPLAQIPVTPRGAISESISQAPSATGHSTDHAPNSGAAGEQ